MPRPKRPPHLKFIKDTFSGPGYVVTAAKIAAGVPIKEFSPWVVAALEEKLKRENEGLLEQISQKMEAGIDALAILSPGRPQIFEFKSAGVAATSTPEAVRSAGGKVSAVVAKMGPLPGERARLVAEEGQNEYKIKHRRRGGPKGAAKG